MRKLKLVAALLGSAAMFAATPALAQEATEVPESDAAADSAIAQATAVDAAQAKIDLLQAQVDALQEAIEGVKAQMVQVTPVWKGAPQLVDKEAGWSFKPRGRLMYDFATVSSPSGYENA